MHELGQVFGHALGQRGNQCPEACLSRLTAFIDAILHLIFNGLNLDWRVDESRWPDNLFGKHAARLFHFPTAGCCRNAHRLWAHNVPFVETQRPVVDAGRQAETIFGERQLAPMVTLCHRADLRHRLVAFVDEQQCIFRQIFKQGGWRFTRQAASQKA